MNARNPLMNTMNESETLQPELRDEYRDFLILSTLDQLRMDQLLYKTDQLQTQGEVDKALQLYEAWTEHSSDPNKFVALFNYGSLLQGNGDLKKAEAAYRNCIQLNAGLSQAFVNLGLVLERQGRHDEAIEQWSLVVAQGLMKATADKAIQVMALNHIGRLYEKLKKYDLAEQALAQSLGIDPKQPGVIQHWVHIRQKACQWPVYKPMPTLTTNDMLMSTSPLAMLSLQDDPVIQLLSAHAFVGRTYGFAEENLCQGANYRHAKIRIGYLSGDLCTHAVGLLMADFLEAHDRRHFEIYAYDFSPEDGTAYRARLKNAFTHFKNVGHLTDRQTAELIRDDEIDVLIDMHGLSSGARPGVCALHPAPLQGTYLGFIGTTAMPWLDFVVADRQVLPEELTPYFTEKPLYLEGSFLPFNKCDDTLPTLSRESLQLPQDAFLMAAFGNVYKLNEDLLDAWIAILRQSDRAVLWLMDDNHFTTEQLKIKISCYGIEEGRVVFSPRSNYTEYLARLKLADLFLDSYPYNCGSTTRDVLNCGVPIVTLRGKTMVSRMGASMLTALGMEELITNDFDEYVQLAVKISNDNSYQADLSKSIVTNMRRKQKSPKLLTASLEKNLRIMLKNKHAITCQ
jgi:predicted O-linked N-acetylglucosamine transferase (SPINDLY family)